MSDHPPFVSVVVPSFNSIRTLASCLDALEAQSYPRERFEIILADNGSTDGTAEFVADRYPRVRMLRAYEKGSGYARNTGMRAAAGEFLLSTDSDCVVNPDWIAVMVEEFQKAAPTVAAIGGPIVPYSEKTPVEQYSEAWVSQPDLASPDLKVRYTATPNAAFRPHAFRQVGGFDGKLGFDDTDLGIRLGEAGYTVGFTPRAIVRHRNPENWKQLYQHKVKYGQFSFDLAVKYPALLGDPSGKSSLNRLFLETTWRIAKDLVKLPFSLIPRPGKPRGWPLIDIAIAWGNYKGYRMASRRTLKS